MTREEITRLIEECKAFYSVYRTMYEDENIRLQWFRTLKNYDKNDIYASLKRHKEGAYSRSPIVLNDLVRDLRTISEKEKSKFENYKTYCKICGRALPFLEASKHEDRCRSTEYMIAQYKKWFKKDLTTRELWALSEEEFSRRYDELLRYIATYSNSEQEKEFIKNYLGDENDK